MDTHQMMEAIQAAENAGDTSALAALFADDVTIVHPGVGPVTGRDANLMVLQMLFDAIEGYHRTFEDVVVDGDAGAFRFTITGTHTGDLPGYPATGERVEIAGAMFFRVRDGQLVHAREMLEHETIRGLSLR